MTKWTKEQEEAIKKSGTNIIVSAGAGSGKTAVLSERVINKLNSGININGLLILTFTKAAAFEMQERIRNKIIENKNLSSQLDLIDNSYITTFDSFALSIVKKYHYLYNIDPYVSIADSNIVLIEKRKIIDDIFNELYIKKDRQFQKLIKDFCVKNDKEIKSAILKISNKLEMKVNYDDYLDNYIDTYFNDKMINNNIKQYEDILINEISSLNNMLSLLKTYTDTTYYEKVLTTLTPIIESNNYQDIKNNLNITIPRLPNGSTEELKTIKTNISNLITNLQKATKYDNINQMKDEYLLTKDYVEIIIKIIKELHNRINQYKNKNDIYEFNDIALLAIKIIKENVEHCLSFTFTSLCS